MKFYDVIQQSKITACSSCVTYAYTTPFPFDTDIHPYLSSVGVLKYDLSKYRVIKIENDQFTVNSRIGTNRIVVKYKKNPLANKRVFELALAAYAEIKLEQKIEVD